MLADSSLLGRLVRSLKKSTSPYRWMGCNIAVYDITIPDEGGLKVRKRRPRRGKRRGRRSGSKVQKRRAVVGCDPAIRVPTPPETPIPTSLERMIRADLRAQRILMRKGYCENRYVKWSRERLEKIASAGANLKRMRERGLPALYPALYQRKRSSLHAAKERWISASSRRSGDSYFFTSCRLRVLLSVSGVELPQRRYPDKPVVVVTQQPAEEEVIHHCTAGCDSDCEEGVHVDCVLPGGDVATHVFAAGYRGWAPPPGTPREPPLETTSTPARMPKRGGNRRSIPLCDCPIPFRTSRGLCVNCSGSIPRPPRGNRTAPSRLS